MTDYNDKVISEWKALFEGKDNFYIYGAALSAQKCLNGARNTGVADKIKGFLVTDISTNCKELEGLPVYDIHVFDEKKANILVYHKGYIKRDILALLSERGFENIYIISKYMPFIYSTEFQEIHDEYMNRAIIRKKLYDNAISKNKNYYKEISERIMEFCEKGMPDFGDGRLYQSNEMIGIDGIRPTLYRLERYGIEKLLNKEQKILDIGCNVGFIDMNIAPLVKGVVGVEYDTTLVEIAKFVCNMTKRENCDFICSDFLLWKEKNVEVFDVVFSFAVHRWMPVTPEEYCTIIDELLSENGILCLESHDIVVGDDKYVCCRQELEKKGYLVLDTGNIRDDGEIVREFVIYKKRHRKAASNTND